MNAKMLLLLAGAGVGGFLLYRNFYGQGAQGGNIITPYANPQLVNQPGLQYPYQANQAPRNDNQSEPWYGGSRAFNTQTAAQQSPLGIDLNFMQNVNYVKGFSEITGSLTSIWDDLGVADWFGSTEDVAWDDSVSDFAGDSFSWDSLTSWA